MENHNELAITVERLAEAACLLEQAVERLAERQRDAEASLGRISATVESTMEERLAAAETRLAELRAVAAGSVPTTVTNRRKTLPTGMTTLLAKQGVTVDSIEAGTLDAALGSLSIEQRIAVKAELMRAGVLG
jgi:hypothetical protein